MDQNLKTTLTQVVSKVKDFTNDTYVSKASKGVANGVASLDSDGKVPSSQLPSYVDDVVEVTNYAALPAQGESGKIYVTLDDNKTYRWSGSTYVEISSSLALGETHSTAYYGDLGKAAYEHSQVVEGNPHNVTKSDVGLGNVENKSVATIKSELTAAAITETETNFVSGGQAFTALESKVDKVAGKGLSSNDFTDAYKNKLDDSVVTSDLVATDQDLDDIFE